MRSLKILFKKAVLGYKKKHRYISISQNTGESQTGISYPGVHTSGYGSYPIGIGGNVKGEIVAKIVKEAPKVKVDGIEIRASEEFEEWKSETQLDVRRINIIYPLIPRYPKKGERVFAYAHIRWSPKDASLVYYVVEPTLTEEDKKTLNEIKKIIMEKLDVDFSALKKGEAKEYLRRKFKEVIDSVLPNINKKKREDFLYYIERDFIGLERIEPLMQDPNIEDISCDGVGIPIFVNHRDPKIGTIKTNVVFDDPEELDAFVNKLAQRCGKTISVAQPLLDATLPDGSRLQATLGTDIARRGSNFTIRKFPDEPLTPTMLLKYGTLDIKMMAYLWFLIENRKSLLISGGTASGKTTILNALSLFIRPEMKIVTIEDTAELRLPHPHWVPHVARKPISEVGGKKLGEVDMFDLLVESLRQRPDYIIVGEVRGKEAYVLFQQIATGHAGLATIHADTVEKLIDRLTTPPIALPGSLIENLDAIVFLSRIKRENKYIRRVSSIFEVVGYDRSSEIPLMNMIFRWNPRTDRFEIVNKSVSLKKIAEQYGLTERKVQRNLGEKMKVLEWMLKKDIVHYKNFAYIMKLYYLQKERLFEMIERG